MKRNSDASNSRSRKIKPVQATNMACSSSGSNLATSNVSITSSEVVEILESPVKSDNDKKEYRVIRLKNGLVALLIADLSSGEIPPQEENPAEEDAMSVDESSVEGEESESGADSEEEEGSSSGPKAQTENETLSAASLTIGVGSFHDPEEIPGLAHFLEHMVFMGSEKYPQENDFDSFIKKQGGHDNAATDWDVTTFYFVSQARHLSKALDKFAQFFISPLMKKDAMQREREAIESEFKLALPSDYHRKKQLLGSFAKKDHPASKFPWGNVATLGGGLGEGQEERDSQIHARLHEFRQKHYVASSMRLALQSRHSLDTLQQWAVDCFSGVPAQTPEQASKQESFPSMPFDTPEFNKFYKVSPVKDICQVDLTWALPSLLPKYHLKPDKYVSWLLGHEGKGSLLHYLREKVWALQLYSGSDDSGADHNSQYLQFGVSLVLTDDGLAHLQEVLEAVFSYLNLLRKVGPQKRIFDEIQNIAEVRFRFSPEPNAGDNVETLSENMHRFPPRHYIAGSELFFDYEPEEITACLSLLTPDTVNVVLLNKNHGETYDHAETWFNTPYSVQDIPAAWMSSWQLAEPLPCFHLPEPNPYLASDFSLVPPEEPGGEEAPPTRLICDERGELWFKQDAKFLLPRAYLCFQLISPLPCLSSTNCVLLDLLISILRQQLTAEVYAAEIAELSYSLYSSIEGTGHGLGIAVSGFNQKLPLLLETVLKQLVRFELDLNEDMFLAIKDKQKKQYFNTFLKPSKLVKDVNQSLLKSSHWTALDRYSAIDDVNVSHLADYARQLRSRLYVRALMQGNVSKAQALEVMTMFRSTLDHKPLQPNTWPQLRLGQAEVGSRLCRVASFNKESANSVVSHSFHCGLATIHAGCVAELIMLLLEETSFDTLRTKEQLGYDVSCVDTITRGVHNFSITVHNQEDKHSVDHVDSRIWSLLRGFREDLAKLTKAELEELRQSAMRHKLRADLQLQEEVDRNWEEVCTEEYLFTRRHIEHEALSKVTLKDMTDWFQRYVFDPEHTRHLSLQVQGYSRIEESLSQIIQNTEPAEVPKQDSTEGKCVPVALQLLVPAVPLLSSASDTEEATVPVSKPISNIEEYRQSLYLYPIHKVIV